MKYFIVAALLPAGVAGFLTVARSSVPCATCPSVPTRSVRVAAEWEPVIGVVIGWPLQVPQGLVCEMAREVDLYVMVHGDRARQRAARTFEEWGIDARRIRFVEAAQGTGYYLPRDWGPYATYDAHGRYRLIDGHYVDYPLSGVDGQRMASFRNLLLLNYRRDDEAPAALAQALGVERTELPIAFTGGNVFFDGLGTGFASQLLIDENRKLGISREQFLCQVRQHFGVPNFHILPNFERIGIQHIDCLFKLLDEERILVKRPPANHPMHTHIEEVVQHLRGLTNPRGRPYQILRIDTPRYLLHKLAAYTNSLIINRKVYVPLFDIEGDQAALETWRQAMPGYEVLGFSHRGWSYTDALHCRVRGVWDPGMLYLSHHRPPCRIPWAKTIALNVQIRDYSGAGLLADRLKLTWRCRGESSWQVAPLVSSDPQDTFAAHLTGVAPGQVLEYYFTAASASGRQETMPRTAPRGVYAVGVGAAE